MDLRHATYLDPKNDLTFRKIFGEHPNIMKSFLNAILPLEEGRFIKSLSYQDPAMLPELPELKHSVVDVRCIDNYDRQFIVEMQMYWTSSFKSRMLFNAGKAYVKQLEKGNKYSGLHPVYGLSLVNDIFLKEDEYNDQYYHRYKLSHQEIPDEEIEGIELIFIELPKFKPQTFTDKKMRNLWLRFLTEINENTNSISEEMLQENSIKEALEQLQISAFSKEELAYYDKYWDKIRVEQSRVFDIEQKYKGQLHDKDQQIEAEHQRAEEERQKAEEERQKLKATVKLLLSLGVEVSVISEKTGLSEKDIEQQR